MKLSVRMTTLAEQSWLMLAQSLAVYQAFSSIHRCHSLGLALYFAMFSHRFATDLSSCFDTHVYSSPANLFFHILAFYCFYQSRANCVLFPRTGQGVKVLYLCSHWLPDHSYSVCQNAGQCLKYRIH